MSRTYRAQERYPAPDDYELALYRAECERGERAHEHYGRAFRDPYDDDPEEDDDDEPF
jgi:hypothetical protein